MARNDGGRKLWKLPGAAFAGMIFFCVFPCWFQRESISLLDILFSFSGSSANGSKRNEPEGEMKAADGQMGGHATDATELLLTFYKKLSI